MDYLHYSGAGKLQYADYLDIHAGSAYAIDPAKNDRPPLSEWWMAAAFGPDDGPVVERQFREWMASQPLLGDSFPDEGRRPLTC